MPVQEPSRKAFISVIEMAELVGLSKSRFHALVKTGVFPQAVLHESCKRPVFDLDSQRKCLEIRETGIGNNGQPIVFNRMKKIGRLRKPRQSQQPPVIEPRQEEHAELVEALKSLGLAATSEAVAKAVTTLYPNGTQGIDQGELIRSIFRHLRSAKK